MDGQEELRKTWEKPNFVGLILDKQNLYSILAVILGGSILLTVAVFLAANSDDLLLNVAPYLSTVFIMLLLAVQIYYLVDSVAKGIKYSRSYIELSQTVDNGVIQISWKKQGPDEMRVYCYRYKNELPVGPYDESNVRNPATRIENSSAQSGEVSDESVRAGQIGFYGFELHDPGNIFSLKQPPATWDFKALAVHVPAKSKEKSPEEKTREQINRVVSSTMEIYQKLEALDQLERQLIKEVDSSELIPTEKERKKEVIRRIIRDARVRLMNVSAG